METNSKERCKNVIDQLNSKFLDFAERNAELFVGYSNNEEADVKDYHSRELLELLQNADDAYQKSIELGKKPKDDLIVEIKYSGNTLTVSNTGTLFDEDGITAIMIGNYSNKGEKYIGNKGTGFRSVLNWANEVSIYSGDYNVRFSKEFANNIFNDIAKNNKKIEEQKVKHPNLHMPMLSVAEYVERPEEYSKKENINKTIIELIIDKEKQKDEHNVCKQINDMDMNILLFLPNITEIQIKTEDKAITYKREKKQEIVMINLMCRQ